MLLFGMLNVVGMYRCEEVMETHLSFVALCLVYGGDRLDGGVVSLSKADLYQDLIW